MPCATRLRGSLNLHALHNSVCALEERHEALRTVFYSENGVNKQRVRPFREATQRVVIIPPNSNDGVLIKALYDEQTTPFNLTEEPGWRVCVYVLGEVEHILSITMHRVVSDGWSLDILRKELAVFCSLFLRGEKLLPTLLCVGAIVNTVPRLPRLATKRAVELEVSKATELLGKTTAEYPTAAFLTDKPRPPTITGKSAFEVLKIEDPIYGTLLSFCRSAHVTVFIALLSVFRVVHYRLTGSSGAVIGCPNAEGSSGNKGYCGFLCKHAMYPYRR